MRKSNFMHGKIRLSLAACVGFLCLSSAFADDPQSQAPTQEPAAFAPSTPAPVKTVLTENQDFDRTTLMTPDYRQPTVSGFSFLSPNRFSMHQSYSVNFASGSYGSTSAGLYLNTVSYKLADPLTLSADIGFYTPLYSTGLYSNSFGGPKSGFQDPRLGSQLILPHIGLEYKPTQNTSLSLHLFNGQDAVKAYGNPADPFNPWLR